MSTVDQFDSDLPSLRARLSAMGGLAEEQLAGALEAVRRRDLQLARRVAAADAELDRRDAAVEAAALRLLALRQPLAQDLRETVAALRISAALERVGDLAKNIARRAESLMDHNRPPAETAIFRMGEIAQRQLADALDAYGARDVAGALDVWKRDVTLDELHNSVFQDLIVDMTRDSRLVSQGAQLLFVAKNIERVGDHTTCIAEMTYYVANGRPLSGERPKASASSSIIDKETLSTRK
ncbi:MAG: phosphate signaling complex protein PhoU [Pseudomonadota bacterium]